MVNIFTTDEVAKATGCPQRNVALYWPLIVASLEWKGINSVNTQIAAAATVAVETGSFAPIQERHADPIKQPAVWALQERYWPSGYFGRGFIQLTHKRNYEKYGPIVGVDLVGHPELAMDPPVSARILAAFFEENRIDIAADVADWKRVRKLVNGGLIGYDKLIKVVNALKSGVA